MVASVKYEPRLAFEKQKPGPPVYSPISMAVAISAKLLAMECQRKSSRPGVSQIEREQLSQK